MSRTPAIVLGALYVMGASAVFAQSTATGSIPAKATVGAVVTVGDATPIDFGTLLPGGTSANVPPSFSATVPHAGSIAVNFANGGITLNVTIDPGNELSRSITDKLSANLACAVGVSPTDAATSQVGCQGQNFNIADAPAGRTAYVFVGGQVTAPANARSGVYNGIVTVRVSITTQ